MVEQFTTRDLLRGGRRARGLAGRTSPRSIWWWLAINSAAFPQCEGMRQPILIVGVLSEYGDYNLRHGASMEGQCRQKCQEWMMLLACYPPAQCHHCRHARSRQGSFHQRRAAVHVRGEASLRMASDILCSIATAMA